MLRRTITLICLGLLLNLTFHSTAAAGTNKDAKFAEKVKTNIAKLGTGRDAKVEVKLKDGKKLKGYVSEINSESFVITNETGTNTEIRYSQPKQVRGNNLSQGVKVAIGLAVLCILFAIPWVVAD